VRWEEYAELLRKLAALLMRSPRTGGFAFQAILGITHGGICVADAIARPYGAAMRVASLWPDPSSNPPTFASVCGGLNDNAIQSLRAAGCRSVLLVDDVCRKGDTLAAAKNFITSAASELDVRTAVLIRDPDSTFEPDFVGLTQSTQGVKTPFASIW
jgi:hypoxanthine phosphoribosyltransferase